MPSKPSSWSERYPELSQWLTYGGSLQVHPTSSGDIEASLGDAGGVPDGGSCMAPTLDELFALVEQMAARWRTETFKLQQSLLSDPGEDLRQWREIRVADWPPVPNPTYDPATAEPVE